MKAAPSTRSFDVHDHACTVYSSRVQLVRLVSRFLAEGLDRHELCWYVGPLGDGRLIRAALRRRGHDADRLVHVGALRFLQPDEVYLPDGGFRPDRTDRVFADAITRARIDGFRGLRVAVDVSRVVSMAGGEPLIAYEAHAQSGFAAAAVTGLCLYHRRKLPLRVVNGALLTHPLTTAALGQAMANPFYDRDVAALPVTPDREVVSRLKTLTAMTRQSMRRRQAKLS
jgi:hypothetical protein